MTAALSLPGPFWLIGCGNMAGAMLEGWLAAGLDRSQITVIRPSGRPPAEGIRTLTSLPEDEVPALVMLGVKPQKLDEVVPFVAPVLEPETVVISILAGVELASLRQRFSKPRTLVRAMPNLPVRLGKGAIGLFGETVGPEPREEVERLMSTLGRAEWVSEEPLIDVVTALAGSAPAFLYRFIDALAEAGVAEGLPREQAERFALATVEGAGAMAAASDESPSQLVERVASPGGTTRAGLEVLDGEGGLRPLMRRTMAAAVGRGRELAEAARR
ncbi:pyrroline-5-carboxylate reductase [Sphingosinicella humi]|uniref:Pyrroline-5-carboxylate reductase n=1 Tax=Allosphingosinicella humi TaxID=2068657 RepID=A0A2U2J1C5_9SPHN|nr:pyrroline-5-carboxylate reductase [Sphingosinicella humi]PWG02140.1 pyrroline-5-carboxylate reductase [Sphingosinicella humi]